MPPGLLQRPPFWLPPDPARGGDPLPDQTSRTSLYAISDFGTSVPAEWTLAGSVGSPLNVDTHRLNLTTSAAGSYADFVRADLTSAPTVSLSDFDVVWSFEITNPLAEQYVSFYGRASNDWINGDSPASCVQTQITNGGRCYLFTQASGAAKITVAAHDFPGGFRMTAGAVYWHRFRAVGDWLFARWWTGLIGDEPSTWTLYGHQVTTQSVGRFKIYNGAGFAAAASNLYIRSFDVGSTIATTTDLSVTGNLFATAGLWSTATTDLSVTGRVPAGGADYLSTVGVGLAGLLEVGTDPTATVTGDRSVTAIVPAEATARLGTVGVGLAGLLPVGSDQTMTPVGVGLSGVVEAGATTNLGTVGVGLAGLVEAGATSRLSSIGIGLAGLLETGATSRLSSVGVGLAGLLETGPATFATVTRDATVTALVPAGESAWLGTIGVGLAALLEAGAAGRIATVGVGLAGILEAGGTARSTVTADKSVTAIVVAGPVAYSPATISVSFAGFLPVGPSGTELVGSVAIVNVAGLALMGITARAAVTVDAGTTGTLETGEAARSTTTANLAPAGHLDIGAAGRSAVTANLAPAGYLEVGLRAGGIVTADLAVAAQLLAGAEPFAIVTRTATATGWVALGTTVNGTLIIAITAVITLPLTDESRETTLVTLGTASGRATATGSLDRASASAVVDRTTKGTP